MFVKVKKGLKAWLELEVDTDKSWVPLGAFARTRDAC